MKRRRRFIFAALALSVAVCTSAAAQETVVTGQVRDVNTRKDISYVNVYVKGEQRGTITDRLGRFNLLVRNPGPGVTVVFQHIVYDQVEISLDSLQRSKAIYLQPRIIPLPGVTVEGEGIDRPQISKDMPQTLSIVEAKNFEIRGYVDAGDLLRTDHSVQVDEELSGRKSIAIRGGNSDEVVVMYNGVKMNNTYNNVFDLSLIDLEDIQRFEIIKGSNTALYGPEAFSGVINIVPKTRLDYNIRFQQRFGTYRSGNWGLHLSPKNLLWKSDRLQANYSYKRGGVERSFIDTGTSSDGALLTNSSTHHTANLGYNFDTGLASPRSSVLKAMYINTNLDYLNNRDNERLETINELASLSYAGGLSRLNDFDLTVSFKRLNELQNLQTSTGILDRDIDDQALHLNLGNTFAVGEKVSLLFAYQFQNSELGFKDVRRGLNISQIGLESATLTRNHHGFVSIAKLTNEMDHDFLKSVDLDLSVRHDRVDDTQNDAILRDGDANKVDTEIAGLFGNNSWSETLVKFAIHFDALKDDIALKSFMKVGSNVKFPTLFQQISSPLALETPGIEAFTNLAPEKNHSLELGGTVTRQIPYHPVMYGWGLSAVYFKNNYDNKFRITSAPGIPVPFYDNVPDARLSGIELKPSLYMFKKKVTLEVGFSRYYISEQAAFPFKSDLKRTFTASIDHLGYALQVLWFMEGEQVGRLRQISGEFAEITLPRFSNLDIHLSKTFKIERLKFFLNASGRNLLNGDDIDLEGIAIRDRRFYVTLGMQY